MKTEKCPYNHSEIYETGFQNGKRKAKEELDNKINESSYGFTLIKDKSHNLRDYLFCLLFFVMGMRIWLQVGLLSTILGTILMGLSLFFAGKVLLEEING